MSYPPHLNRLPQLPPGIRPPHFAGFPQGVPAGTPMIPVHMGIMTSAPTVLVPTTVSMVQKPPAQRKELNPVRAKENQEGGSGPTTTVFVGNISEKASDMLVRQLLAKCGLVLSWKRVQGASGKLQAFGFCEYKEPESTLRSLRLLHELLLGDKKLLVKVDAKTKAQLEEWKARKRNANGGAMSEEGLKEEEEEEEEDLDEDTKRRDQIVKGAIEGLIREYGSELNAPSQDGDNQPRKKKREKKEEVVASVPLERGGSSEDINVMEMEDDKRDLISREISKFRDTHKKLEEEKGKKEQERQEIDKDRRERDKERERERERRDREREKEKERNDNIKERERDRDRDRIDRERERTKEREWERGERERGERERGERERVKERSREVSKDRSKSRERSRDEKKHDREEDQEEAYERRKLERKMRDKETAYQERLKNWEIRERKKARDYDKENQREEERRHEMTKEGKRLKEFLEDYDDDRDESKYYRGSALQKRLRDREKETELDDRDRKREKEEHDQIRQRLLAEGHPDPEAELQRMEEEAERRRQPPVKPEEEVQQEKPHREREHREHREREHRERENREREHHRDRRGGGGGGADRPPPEHPQSQSDDDVEDGEELDDRDEDDSSDARTHPHLKPTLRPITSAPSVSSGSGGATPNSPGNESPCGIIIPHENSPDAQPTDEHRPKIGLSLKLGAGASPSHQIHTGSKRKKLANVDSVFNKFGEEEADEAPRKRKLVPLDYGEDDKSLGLDGAEVPGGKGGQNTEEKRKHIRSLIEKIPTARPDLFNYPLDWTAVDSTLMDRRIRPWINKKIIEYIGEEEATLVDFVCSKVMSHGTPQGILDDVAMVLDEEAEVFIVKMWRLLIYETEAKKIGLGK
ncbi:RNA-binding protein 25-like [Oncorhynchus keta]|uniref:RNA-binding protein 25-like n=1 Tax=Oncorhynchus keta TaxID=8018 RepID=UPI00227B6929|nr:RNA-binding protein 25-like [Oncorhynchus keta]